MSLFHSFVLTGLTDGSGAATVDAEIATPGWMLWSVEWVFGSGTAGVDATFTDRNGQGGVTKTLLTLTNADANSVYRPRAPMHDTAGAVISSQYTYFMISGQIRMVIAQGGSAKTYIAIINLVKD